MNTKHKTLQKIMPLLCVIVLLTFFMWTVNNMIYNRSSNPQKALDNVCKEKGYKKCTDYSIRAHSINSPTSISTECDSKIIGMVECHKPCIKHNKWGDCEKRETRCMHIPN